MHTRTYGIRKTLLKCINLSDKIRSTACTRHIYETNKEHENRIQYVLWGNGTYKSTAIRNTPQVHTSYEDE